MIIKVSELIKGAKKADGTVVIIDVLRAATTAAYLISGGANEVIAVEGVEEALLLKKKNPGYILVGELSGLKVKGFDYGNSPSAIKKANLKNKTIIFRTSSGVAGIYNAKNADEILFAGFVTAKATAEHIKKKKPKTATLVAMGWEGTQKAFEDEACADYINALITGEEINVEKLVKKIRDCDTAKKFFENKPDFPEEDFRLATEFDRFDFAIRALKVENHIILQRT